MTTSWYHHHFQPIRTETQVLVDAQLCDYAKERCIVAPEAEWADLADFCNCPQLTQPNRTRVLVGELFEPWEGHIEDAKGRPLFITRDGGWTHHEDDVPTIGMADIRARFFALADECPGVDFILETRWPENVAEMMPDCSGVPNECPECTWPRDNVWLCVPIATQADADRLLPAPALLQSPAAKRVVRCRPVERIDFYYSVQGADWMVVELPEDRGGVPYAHLDEHFARSLVSQCRAAGVPVWFAPWPGIPEDLRIQEVPG